MNRRNFIEAAAGLGLAMGAAVAIGGEAAWAVTPKTEKRKAADFNYKLLSEAQPSDEFFDVLYQNGRLWSDAIRFGYVGSTRLQETGTEGKFTLNNSGSKTGGVSNRLTLKIQTNKAEYGVLKGSDGVRIGGWYHGESGDMLETAVLNPDGSLTLLGRVRASTDGFMGFLLPERSDAFMISIDRVNQGSQPVLEFGALREADQLKPASPVVLEALQPDRSMTYPISYIGTAPRKGGGYFTPISIDGRVWDRTVSLGLPEDPDSRIRYYEDTSDPGINKVYAQLATGVTTSDAYFDHHKAFDYQGLRSDSAGLVVYVNNATGKPGGTIALLDINRNPIVETNLDGTGFGGVRVPFVDTQFGVRYTTPDASTPTFVRFQIGPESFAERARNLANIIDTPQYIMNHPLTLAIVPQGVDSISSDFAASRVTQSRAQKPIR